MTNHFNQAHISHFLQTLPTVTSMLAQPQCNTPLCEKILSLSLKYTQTSPARSALASPLEQQIQSSRCALYCTAAPYHNDRQHSLGTASSSASWLHGGTCTAYSFCRCYCPCRCCHQHNDTTFTTIHTRTQHQPKLHPATTHTSPCETAAHMHISREQVCLCLGALGPSPAHAHARHVHVHATTRI
jgi:hypothetical protein